MSTLNGALQKAGIAITVNARIWRYIQDHPGQNVLRIAGALNMPRENVSSAVSNMYRRAMLNRIQDYAAPTRIGGRDNSKKLVNTYTVSQKMRGVYEVLPLVKDSLFVRKSTPASVLHIIPEPPPPKPTVKTAAELIESMSVKEAFAVFTELKTIFKGPKTNGTHTETRGSGESQSSSGSARTSRAVALDSLH